MAYPQHSHCSEAVEVLVDMSMAEGAVKMPDLMDAIRLWESRHDWAEGRRLLSEMVDGGAVASERTEAVVEHAWLHVLFDI